MNVFQVDYIKPAAQYIANTIKSHLAHGEQVLWLLAGGSAISVAIEVSGLLSGLSLKGLTVTLTDERYGPVNHKDSNWYQLQTKGFYLQDAVLKPVLDGSTRDDATRQFAVELESRLQTSDFSIGLFGVGADGHTAGILPKSPAVYSDHYAVAYDADTFERITMTPVAIKKLDEAVVYAVGDNKWPALEGLTTGEATEIYPVQTLKQVPKLTLFSDYRGED